jgi:hypothetical protein
MASRMERTRTKTMKQGAVLFAFNSPTYDYFAMAEYAAERISRFLNIPVSIVTDKSSLPDNPKYKFNDIILVEPDITNTREWGVWINKGRYQAYDLSPYDETLLLDVDYIVNSDKLKKLFELGTDFACHDTTEFLMQPNLPQEYLSPYSHKSLWATVIYFKKTNRTKQIFESLKMVQDNYEHYANIHQFVNISYRNDYALTLAVNIVNGHIIPKSDIIPWSLVHVGKNTLMHKTTDNESTDFLVTFDNWKNGKIRKEYMIIKDLDFHMMNKNNVMELVNG